MWVSDQQILKAIRAGVARLSADLAGTGSAHLLSAIDIAVGELASRCGDRLESMHDSCIDAKRLALHGAALAARVGASEFVPRAQALPEPAQSGLAAIDASYAIARQLLGDCVLLLNGAVSEKQGDTTWRTEVSAFFRELAQHEKQRAMENAAAPAIESGERRAGLRIEEIASYFAAWTGTPALPGPLELVDAKPLSEGISRQTILIKVKDKRGLEHRLILRKQVPGGFLDGACNTLAEERPFLELCKKHDLPVPGLFRHETDASILDDDFFITEYMPGTTIESSYQMTAGIGAAFFKQLARMLATLHGIDWSSPVSRFATELCASSRLPAGASVNAEQAARAMVGQFEAYWRAANLEPLPTFELMVDWLKRNVPPTDRNVALCHGDIGFHNLLVKDGRISALLDWKTSRLCDPAWDISYIRPMVSRYVEWKDFLGWYCAAGGPEFDQASLDYYGVFCAFARVIVCEAAMGSAFATSATPDLEYLRLGLPLKAALFDDVLRDGAPIWGGR